MAMHLFSTLYSPFTPRLIDIVAPLIIMAVLWTITLKGFALWYAARGSQKWWFIVLLVFNTLGILEIVYLIWFQPKREGVAVPPSVAVDHDEASGGVA